MAQAEQPPQPGPQPQTLASQTPETTSQLPSLPPEVLRHHLAPALSLTALRAFRRASRAVRDDAAHYAIRSIKRAPGTHPLPTDLGARFPLLVRLDLSGDSQLAGGLELFRALQSASRLTSLDLAGCSTLPASFVRRQLVEACPRLQHLALSCCCSAGADTEAAVLAALAAAPLAATLTSLELHCGGAFQPELQHLAGLGQRLTALRVYGSRTLDDDAVAALPRVAPALAEMALVEQQSRRGRHVRGEGLAALGALGALRSLSLACADPDERRMAAALASLTQLRELDLSRCEPRLLEAMEPLGALVCVGGALQRLYLPTAYTAQQLARGLPAVFGGGGGGEGGQGDEEGQKPAAMPAAPAAQLQALRLHASAELPEAVVSAMSRLAGLRELSLSYCGPAGSGAAVAAVAAALTGLTAFRLVQEYGGFAAEGDAGDGGGGGSGTPGEPESADRGDPRVSGGGGVFTWYDGLLTWRCLRQLELAAADGVDDRHLYDIGRALGALSYFSLSRNGRATGAGFASWPAGCRGLTALTLYDCARVGDAAIEHVAALPLRSLTLAHLPEVGAAGMLRLAGVCTTLRSLTLERLAGAPGAALAALWRLPLLEALCLRMCTVNNLTLETALLPAADQLPAKPAAVAAAAAAAAEPAVGAEPEVQAPAQSLTWLELQGSLVSTAGLWPLRRARGLTHLDLSNCRSVGDGVADLLLHGGGGGGRGRGGREAAGEAAGPAAAPAAAPVGGGGGGAETTEGGASARSGAAVEARPGGAMLLPCLLHVDLRGCKVAESTLERLRRAGLAVDPGTGTWR